MVGDPSAAITLLHVVRPESSAWLRGTVPIDSIQEKCEAGERQLSQLIDVLWGESLEAEAVVAMGKPSEQIVNEARETKADLIVMGGHALPGCWGLLRRGTTPKVIRKAPCPVLVVPLLEHGFVVEDLPIPLFQI